MSTLSSSRKNISNEYCSSLELAVLELKKFFKRVGRGEIRVFKRKTHRTEDDWMGEGEFFFSQRGKKDSEKPKGSNSDNLGNLDNLDNLDLQALIDDFRAQGELAEELDTQEKMGESPEDLDARRKVSEKPHKSAGVQSAEEDFGPNRRLWLYSLKGEAKSKAHNTRAVPVIIARTSTVSVQPITFNRAKDEELKDEQPKDAEKTKETQVAKESESVESSKKPLTLKEKLAKIIVSAAEMQQAFDQLKVLMDVAENARDAKRKDALQEYDEFAASLVDILYGEEEHRISNLSERIFLQSVKCFYQTMPESKVLDEFMLCLLDEQVDLFVRARLFTSVLLRQSRIEDCVKFARKKETPS